MTTSCTTPRRGRPHGSRKVDPAEVIRIPIHLTVHRRRQPLLSAWLSQQLDAGGAGRGLAPDLVDLIERALAGGRVELATGGGVATAQVYDVDMSGLLEWD